MLSRLGRNGHVTGQGLMIPKSQGFPIGLNGSRHASRAARRYASVATRRVCVLKTIMNTLFARAFVPGHGRDCTKQHEQGSSEIFLTEE
ncbi:hypothetical protein PILCRDRAFT_828250 [Piloderma croceum F 1598]|uniref:Uncharacterized protein n=1 Tax=Piloderma croceum (strain F 1598) TaxID=765440 RepID=A0A0C3BAQ5_PILCF|nr:hypothetical protein PILCRDRAFT_828250 [Piloderma croceum F 1598]